MAIEKRFASEEYVSQNIEIAKTEFDSHVEDATAHMSSAQKSQLTTAYNHSQETHAPSNAQANQNAFSNIAVSGQTTVAADSATDTVTFAGSNVSITTDATNDKVTFSVADGTTSAKGLVKLTNSTSSTSTTTAATPSSVKSAYDLANTAKTNAATAQTKADDAYELAASIDRNFNEFKSHESQVISGSNLTLTVHRSGGANNIIIEQLNADVTANSTVSESGVQAKFRPNIEVNKIVCISASASATIFARLIITTGGVVKLTFFSNRNAGSKIYINETYV